MKKRNAFLAEESKRLGIVRRTNITDDEIVKPLYVRPRQPRAPQLLGEGVSLRPGDEDVVWIYGYGFPWYQGGPMWWADSIGARNDLRTRSSLGARRSASTGSPHPKLKEAAESGSFAQRPKIGANPNALRKQSSSAARARSIRAGVSRCLQHDATARRWPVTAIKHAVERSGVDPNDFEDTVVGTRHAGRRDGVGGGTVGAQSRAECGDTRRLAAQRRRARRSRAIARPACKRFRRPHSASSSTVRPPWSLAAPNRSALVQNNTNLKFFLRRVADAAPSRSVHGR